jgi:hypothetical protein
MVTLFGIGFTAPMLLAALAALPVLWWLLRAVPPAPVRRRFPGIALLLGLREKDPESQRTPWWLLALRVGAVAALILALAGPVLNPRQQGAGEGPLLILFDGTWAEGRDWPRRIERAQSALEAAQVAGRPVAVMSWADPPSEGPQFRLASAWVERLGGLAPQPWAPAPALPDWVAGLPEAVETLWISDGIAHDGRDALLAALAARGAVSVHQPETPIPAMTGVSAAEGGLVASVRRGGLALPEQALTVLALGRDPAGVERDLARAPVALAAGAREGVAVFDLPPELRNRIARFQIEGARGAGAVHLADDSLRRRKVALLSVREGTEALALLAPLHYLRQALVPSADLVEAAGLDDLLLATPDVIVLADAPRLTDSEAMALRDWVERGGLLLRFAGPRLAGADPLEIAEDPLLPVRLRTGGRTVGGALSWGAPQRLAPFRDDSPFAGLEVPAEVEVRAQVLAQPGPDLVQRSIAELTDGTPLVTRRALGQGQVVLFHVTAGADWSSLPLSGLFVQMLERLAVSTSGAEAGATQVEGRVWTLEARLDGFGGLVRAGDRGAIPGAELAEALAGSRAPGAVLPPGLYAAGETRVALNATGPQTVLAAADWPQGTVIEAVEAPVERNLAGWLFAAAILALAVDALATLALGGRLVRVVAVAVGLAVLVSGQPAQAQAGPQVAAADARVTDEARALATVAGVVLAHVASGDPRIDEVALAGLRGLSDALFRRTSVEPGAPVQVDLERDDLALFPFLYWPVTADSPLPGAEATQRLNRFLRSGGMILFDTMDTEQARLTGAETPAARRLRAIAAGLDIPPLEPVPADHVLTRTFYLLGDFPGRHQGATVWVEAAPPDAERAEGMPFRNLNDGVSPVVMGGNDWAAAWAIDTQGRPLLPIGRGTTGERQREMALRFGINLILYVLSGNYKSDQVHVPALLERLGQ